MCTAYRLEKSRLTWPDLLFLIGVVTGSFIYTLIEVRSLSRLRGTVKQENAGRYGTQCFVRGRWLQLTNRLPTSDLID